MSIVGWLSSVGLLEPQLTMCHRNPDVEAGHVVIDILSERDPGGAVSLAEGLVRCHLLGPRAKCASLPKLDSSRVPLGSTDGWRLGRGI